MTSEERRCARRKRREIKREKKKREYLKQYDDFNNLTDINHLRHSAYMSEKETKKKASVQRYMINMLQNVTQSRNDILNHRDVRQGFIEFDLRERGKCRHIKAVHFKERVIQRCLCDYMLVPAFTRSLVYDNGASLKGKGIHFALYRLRDMLRKYARKNGNKGYILLVDFSGYFDNIMHLRLYYMLKDHFSDPDIIFFIWKFIKAFGNKSLGIGSQISQILAVSYANRVDHRIKEYHRNGKSARYMDDSYVISDSKEELECVLQDCIKYWDKLGIVINLKKTRIEPVRAFTFLKARFRITNTNKVLMLPPKKTYTIMRHKLKAFKRFYDDGDMGMKDISCSYTSWKGYQTHFDSYRRLKEMDIYFKSLFGGDECNYAVLQR